MQPRNPTHSHTLLEEIRQHCHDPEVHSDDELVALVKAIASSEHLAGVWTLEDEPVDNEDQKAILQPRRTVCDSQD